MYDIILSFPEEKYDVGLGLINYTPSHAEAFSYWCLLFFRRRDDLLLRV
jgi:hypothetical protein